MFRREWLNPLLKQKAGAPLRRPPRGPFSWGPRRCCPLEQQQPQQQQQHLQQQQRQRQRSQLQHGLSACASVRGLAQSASARRVAPAAAAAATATATAAAATTTAAATAAAAAAAGRGAWRGPQGPLWGFVRREGPSKTVEDFLKGDRGNSRLLLLTGTEGIGKASLLRDCSSRVAKQHTRKPILLAFDVGMMEHRSFAGFLSVARKAASRQLAAACSDLDPVSLVQRLAAASPSFVVGVAAAFRPAAAAATRRQQQQQLQQQQQQQQNSPADEWLALPRRETERVGRLVQQLQQEALEPGEDLCVVLKWLSCLYAAMEFAQEATQRPVTLLLRCPEVLLEGSALRFQGGPLFYELMTAATAEKRSVGTVFSVGDGVTALMIQGATQPQDPDALEEERVKIVELEELNREEVRDLFEPLLCADASVAEAAFLAVGGNPRLIRLIFEDLQQATVELLQQLSRRNAEEQEAAERRQRDFDDCVSPSVSPSLSLDASSPLAKNAFLQNELLLAAATRQQDSKDAILRKFEKVHCMQQQRLRLMSETLLVEEFRRFEALTLQFLSFPLIRKLRDVSKNEVHFLVLVCETIRAFLRRPYVLCPDLHKVNNTILLGLLDAGLARPKFDPPRIEVSGVFHKNLLQSFCNLKYDSLSTTQKAEYSLNFLLNQKHIETCLDSLKDPKL
ncbi:hypothetical protein Emed_004060 [Eimeria media]